MSELADCLGRIYRPLQGCKTCVKDEGNLRCPCYQPHSPVELIDIGDVDTPRTPHTLDEYGDGGNTYLGRSMSSQ